MIGVTRSIKQSAGQFRKKILKKIKSLIWQNRDKNWNSGNDNWDD